MSGHTARTLVVGFGVTGRAVAARLAADGVAVTVVDDAPAPDAPTVAARSGAVLVTAPSGAPLADLVAGADEVVVSPGVPVTHPVYDAAAAAGTPLVSEVELAWRLGHGPGAPQLVAITGTNGKTTVTTLVRDALERSGRSAAAAGNIGSPLVEVLAAGRADVVVAEVSSFQLQFTAGFHPTVSCWLNFAPDHLDWHPDLAHYAEAKARIWANQGPGDTVVVNAADDAVVSAAARRPAGSRLVTFSTLGPADWWEDAGALLGPTGAEVLPVDALARSLPHDRANALAAAAVATAAGATPEGIAAALRAPLTLRHRVELVADAGGVRWYDDSKATTPASVAAAVAGFGSVVLVAGGRNKGLDLSVLATTVPPVRSVVAIGEAADEVSAAFRGLVPVSRASSMAAAVAAAASSARPGDAVILSPGCASFDWYRSYGERGDDFARWVRDLVGTAVQRTGPRVPDRQGST